MLIEIDQVAVRRDLLAKARAGDAAARTAIAQELKGLTLYMHNLYCAALTPETHELISLREAHELNLVNCVTVGE